MKPFVIMIVTLLIVFAFYVIGYYRGKLDAEK